MTKRPNQTRRWLFATALLIVTVSGNAQQTEDPSTREQSTRKAQAVSQRVYEQLQEVLKHIDADNGEGALQILKSMLDQAGLSDYELAQALNLKGFVEHGLGETQEAIDTYKLLLAIPYLELTARQQATYVIAQLQSALENYDGAIEHLEEWFSLVEEANAAAYVLYAQNLYQLARYEDLLEPLEMAITKTQAQGNEVKENWYVLQSFAYFRLENYEKVRDIHKLLLESWPSKQYWLTLAAAFAELHDDVALLSTYDALYLQGLLNTEGEFITLTQLYLQHEIPHKAGELLEMEIDAGRVAGTTRDYRLLSQAWSLAHEHERSIPALTQAANLSEDGELDIRLANSLLNTGRYSECAGTIDAGLAKGSVRSPEMAYVTLGVCLYNEHEYVAAKGAFRKASTHPATAKMAEGWIEVIASEIERNRQIDEAVATTEMKIRQLENRRAATEDS